MELIRGLVNILPRHNGCVATIGNFDGIHLGHQQILADLQAKAQVFQLPSLLITFEPQPREYFDHDKMPARLTRLREKLLLLQDYQLDRVLCLRFNRQLTQLPAHDFVEQILVDKLGVRYLVIGRDFRFGHQRRGDFNLLQKLAKQHNFIVAGIPEVTVAGDRVSSSRIRSALEAGDMKTAGMLLGRPYRMSGRVVQGDKRGRIIGFPTANIFLQRRVSPLRGVFAAKLYGIDDKVLKGVANVGFRPTVDGTRCLLEVHIFDFAEEIYGRYVEVEFITKIRDEQRFDSLELLKQQIYADAKQARQFFSEIKRND